MEQSQEVVVGSKERMLNSVTQSLQKELCGAHVSWNCELGGEGVRNELRTFLGKAENILRKADYFLIQKYTRRNA